MIYCPLLQTTALFAVPLKAAAKPSALRGQYERRLLVAKPPPAIHCRYCKTGLTHEKQEKLKRGKRHHRNSGGVFWQDDLSKMLFQDIQCHMSDNGNQTILAHCLSCIPDRLL